MFEYLFLHYCRPMWKLFCDPLCFGVLPLAGHLVKGYEFFIVKRREPTRSPTCIQEWIASRTAPLLS